MGSVLCAVTNLLVIGQRIAFWVAAACVLTCLAITIITMLGLGVGLGYNYCFVDIKSKHRYIPGRYEYEVVTKTKQGRRHALRTMENETDLAKAIEKTLNVLNLNKTIQNSTSASDTNTEEKDVFDAIFEDDTTESIVQEIPKPTTTIIQLDGLDLMTLLTKLKSENRSYSLQIVTT